MQIRDSCDGPHASSDSPGRTATTNYIASRPSLFHDRVPPPAPKGTTAWFDTCQYLMLGDGVKVGHALSTPEPAYSDSARLAKIKGDVLLAVALNATGTVDAVKVLRSLEPGLDHNAIHAVKQWKFTPAMKDGKPVAVQFEVTVGFSLY
jgi:TonB family protein